MRRICYLLCCMLLYAATACNVHEINISEKCPDSHEVGEDAGYSDPDPGYNCNISDGIHQAQVVYKDTADGRTYRGDQDVEVSGCKLIRIYFPGHELNETNMAAAAINREGAAYITDSGGRHYNIYIRNTEYRPTTEIQPEITTSTRSGACNGSKNCSVCTNCTRCRHCHKNGGTCGVCK